MDNNKNNSIDKSSKDIKTYSPIDIKNSPKDKFIENIKNWVSADSQLKIINEKTK